MLNNDHSVVFQIDGVNNGFTEVSGLLKLGHRKLILEFQAADAILGVIKSDLKEVEVPFESIRKFDLKKGWFSTRLTIQTKSMSDLKDVPGAKSGAVVLRVKKKDREDALALNSRLLLELSEYRLELLDE